MELKRDEIIKALECCQIRHIEKNCDECYYHRWLEPTCRGVLCEDTLALIKELTATNESLEAAIVALKEEIKLTRADTVRKMAERLKRYYDVNDRYLGYSIAYNIDQEAERLLHQLTPADNKCVACGDIIPEGRQVCPGCEVKV